MVLSISSKIWNSYSCCLGGSWLYCVCVEIDALLTHLRVSSLLLGCQSLSLLLLLLNCLGFRSSGLVRVLSLLLFLIQINLLVDISLELPRCLRCELVKLEFESSSASGLLHSIFVVLQLLLHRFGLNNRKYSLLLLRIKLCFNFQFQLANLLCSHARLSCLDHYRT